MDNNPFESIKQPEGDFCVIPTECFKKLLYPFNEPNSYNYTKKTESFFNYIFYGFSIFIFIIIIYSIISEIYHYITFEVSNHKSQKSLININWIIEDIIDKKLKEKINEQEEQKEEEQKEEQKEEE